MNKISKTFRLSEKTISQLRDDKTETVEMAVDLLWHIQASDADVVAAHGSISFERAPGWRPGTEYSCYKFQYRGVRCGFELPQRIVDISTAITIAAQVIRGQLIISAGGNPKFVPISPVHAANILIP